MKTLLLVSAAVFLAAGCSSTLVNQRANLKKPAGIPWTEPRNYDVYVYVGGETVYIPNPDDPKQIVASQAPKQLYVGTHALLDVVNTTVIDDNRPKWDVNYRALAFSDGGIELDLDDTGAIKRVKATGKANTKSAVEAAQAVAKNRNAVKDEELAELKRKAELIKAKNELNALENPPPKAGTTDTTE